MVKTVELGRITKSIKIDPELWHTVKVACAMGSVEISTYLEDLIKADLKKRKLPKELGTYSP